MMIGLPDTTEMNRPLPKKAIFDKFKPNPTDRQRFDAEIHRLSIVNEVSALTTTIAVGEEIKGFYVILVSLRSGECSKKNLELLAKLISQNILFVLEYEGKARLAVYRTGKLIQSEWRSLDEWRIRLTGLNFDTVWENIITQIGGVEIANGRSLNEQLAADDERKKLLQRTERLEKQARNEKQPRRKWELVEEVRRLREGMEVK